MNDLLESDGGQRRGEREMEKALVYGGRSKL